MLNELNEPMPAEITNTIRGIAAALDTIKKLSELSKNSQNVELKQTIVSVQEQLLEVKQELVLYKEENAELKQQLKNLQNEKPQLIFKNGCYFSIKEDGSDDGPYCTGCFDKDKKIIRLIKMSEYMDALGKYKCPACNAIYT